MADQNADKCYVKNENERQKKKCFHCLLFIWVLLLRCVVAVETTAILFVFSGFQLFSMGALRKLFPVHLSRAVNICGDRKRKRETETETEAAKKKTNKTVSYSSLVQTKFESTKPIL